MPKWPQRLSATAIAVIAALLVTLPAAAYSTDFEDPDGYSPDLLDVPGMTFIAPGGVGICQSILSSSGFYYDTTMTLCAPGTPHELQVSFDRPQEIVSFDYLIFGTPTPIEVVGKRYGQVVYTTTLTGSSVGIPEHFAYQIYAGSVRLEVEVDTLVLTSASEDYVGFAIDNIVTVQLPLDDGINGWHDGRPVAIYAQSDGFDIYGIDINTGDGALAGAITGEMIDAAGIPTGGPVVIAEGQNPYNYRPFTLYRLPTGEFQLNTFYWDGKPYVVKWAEGANEVTPLEW